jgi:hypothetical protein
MYEKLKPESLYNIEINSLIVLIEFIEDVLVVVVEIFTSWPKIDENIASIIFVSSSLIFFLFLRKMYICLSRKVFEFIINFLISYL